MSAKTRLTRLALASAISLAAAQASASVRLSEAFDGAYFDPAASGRGVLVDWVPNANRAGGTFFAADFVYDAAGNPFWISLQQDWSEFQFSSTTVPVFRNAAGTWAAPGAQSLTRIGTASVTVNSCNSITIAYTMDAASGLPNRTQTLQRLGGADASSCAYQQTFTACPSFATAAPSFGPRACTLPATLTGNQTLTNNITWVMSGKVQVGTDTVTGGTAASLRIEPGTLLVSTGASANSFDHLAVNRGSKIFAEGTRDFPIIMTTANELPGAPAAPAPGQLGGLVIFGGGPSNCFPNCRAEWDTATSYGGDFRSAVANNDSSGVIRYMQVRYAGYVFSAGRELNSFTFAGVGRGTTIEYVQAFRGADDGLEWFGGNANVRYALVTCPGDDGFDWDEGYTGKLQFGVVEMRGCGGSNHGFELSNSPSNADAEPRARGTVANVTVIGPSAASSNDGMQLNSGTGGNFFNVIVGHFNRSCVQIAGAPTAAAAGNPGVGLSGVLTAVNLKVFGCGSPTSDGTGVANYTASWFNSQTGNENLTTSPLAAGSFLPNGAAPAGVFPPVGATAPGLNDWFVPTDYVGAFRSNAPADNWTLGWARPFNP